MRPRLAALLLLPLALLPGCKKLKIDVFKLPWVHAYTNIAIKAGADPEAAFAFFFDVFAVEWTCELVPGVLPPPKGSVKDTVIAITATEPEAHGFVRDNRILVPPFRVEAGVGVYAPESYPDDTNGFFSFEIDRTGPLAQFVALAGLPQKQGGSLDALLMFVADESGNHGQLLAGSMTTDVAIEATDTGVGLQLRLPGDTDWQTIDTLPPLAADSAWRVGWGGVNMNIGARFDLQYLDVVSNSAPAAAPGSLDEAHALANDALHGTLRAKSLLEGAAPGTAAAHDRLALAWTAIDGAMFDLGLRLDADELGKAGQRARKDLTVACKKVEAALEALDIGQPAKIAAKRVDAAVKRLIRADFGLGIELQLAKM